MKGRVKVEVEVKDKANVQAKVTDKLMVYQVRSKLRTRSSFLGSEAGDKDKQR